MVHGRVASVADYLPRAPDTDGSSGTRGQSIHAHRLRAFDQRYLDLDAAGTSFQGFTL